jgi:subtilase family protein
MNSARPLALALLLALGLLSSASRTGAAAQDQPAADISAAALAQIDALMAEKDSRTPEEQKIDSQLLYERRMESGQSVADGIWFVETDLPYADDGHLIVDIRARAGSGLASRLPAAGVDVVFESADGSDIRAHLDVAQVEGLAADPDVIFIQPRQAAMVSGQSATPNVAIPTGQGSRSSEGDVTHLAFAARGAFHVDGSGLKIGVLSDGVRSLGASQAAGDLGPVTVIGPAAPCPAANTCDEGTAMLEVIHDLAPGAQLYFASAFVSITSFADNIRALRAAGCDIIVDDVFYFVETPFQNGQAPAVVSPTNGGVVIQAVRDVTASGALYFSAAGNSGNLDAGTSGAWEGDFVDGGPTGGPLPAGGRIHNFGGQNFNLLTAANTAAPITLYWSDPLGGSSNDYDLFRLSPAGNAIAAASTNIQNGRQDPIEQISQSLSDPRIVVVKRSSAQPRFLHLNTNRGRLSIPTAGATRGHATVPGDGAYGVAATQAGAVFPQPFNTGNIVETFSSDGPRHIFYDADGTPITRGNVSSTGGQVLQKPDITAADGVGVTGAGGFPSPFFGTSAAAPHAAAIAALVKSADPSLTAAQVRSILTSTALDIQAPGVDRDSGAGIIMARSAVIATGARGTAFLHVDDVQFAENPGNANGILEAGEGARMTITVKNYGVAPATAISAAVTSPTSGVTIAQPGARAYPTLAPMASATNSAPVLLTLASDFGCARAADFRVQAAYGGGNGPMSEALSIPIGATTYTVTRALDGSTPPSSPGVATAAGLQIGRLFRDGVASACGAPKVINSGGAANPVDSALRHYESYQFRTCANSAASCATVTLQGTNASTLFTAAYSSASAPTFNPNNIRQNYRGDPGSSAESRTYSFDVGGGGQSVAIDVHDLQLTTPSGTVYQLTLSGLCTGGCDPPNHPPVARAKHATVAADAACVADASIDDGSSDADGDPLTFSQSPPPQYALGTTPVVLTVTDTKGAFSQANGDVSVVDQTPPAIGGLSLSPAGPLWPPNHKMVDVSVDFGVADNCSAATCVLTVSSNEAIDGSGDGNTSPDWQVVDAHHVRLRAERSGNGSGRIYTLTLTCTDAAGNQTVRTATVLVPHNH